MEFAPNRETLMSKIKGIEVRGAGACDAIERLDLA